MFTENSIIITSTKNKKRLLKNRVSLNNIKIYTINEFKKLYYFDYNKETLFYIINKYNTIVDIAKIYINNLYFIENKTYNSKKIKFLLTLKNELLANNLIKINPLFKASLKNKTIYFYNLYISKEIKKLINELESSCIIKIINTDNDNNSHQIYEFKNIEDELTFVASEICKLIKKGISLKNIYLTNIDSEYKKHIRKIFPMYNIPITLTEENTIFETHICNQFLENYSEDLNIALDKIKLLISEDNIDIYNKIINIINEYSFENDKNKVKSMIVADLKNTKLPNKDNQNSVHEEDLLTADFIEDHYVFLLSFNQGVIPLTYKDEEFLSDKDKKELPISNTLDKNNQSKAETISKIKNIKNLTITYKLHSQTSDYYISNLNEELNYKVLTPSLEYNYSNLHNKLKLTSLIDEYHKYGTKSDLLFTLNNTYNNLPYQTYNNQFTGLNKDLLKEYLNNKLVLSYTRLDNYFRCPFSYYLNYILELNAAEKTFYQHIGTLFHNILEKLPEPDFTLDNLWQEEIDFLNYQFNNQELFFLKKLKEELRFILKTIKEQEKYTDLHQELHEEKVYTSISGEISITFKGIIDKIKYKKEDNQTIIAIIDYKTGNPNLDLTTLKYGIGMQLPIYLYLAKNSPKIKNIKVAGFYLQKILNNEILADKKHTYEELKTKNLILQGYSNEDISILEKFDLSYQDSNLIKSMKVTNDNSFGYYSKVLTTAQIDKITALAESKIIEGSNRIINAEFLISPKKIGKENLGCSYCKFKDICYKTNKDIEELEPLNLEDILGGDDNGLD